VLSLARTGRQSLARLARLDQEAVSSATCLRPLTRPRTSTRLTRPALSPSDIKRPAESVESGESLRRRSYRSTAKTIPERIDELMLDGLSLDEAERRAREELS
jgi:hypothetical protein